MRFNRVIIFFILIFITQTWAQIFSNSISGFVIDDSNKEPLAGVNVYISNTVWGSSTDQDGHFKIQSIPPGTHELVLSMIGYQVKTQMIVIKKNTKKKINFRMNPQLYETEAITVVAADNAEWYINLNIFKDKFIGKTPFSKQCFIKNEPVLDFTWDNNILLAKAKEPLIIINKALGYKMHSVLIAFSWDKSKEYLTWMAKNRYIELIPKDEHEAKIWKKNRDETFEYSQIYFYNWLKSSDQKDEFELQYYQVLPVHLLNSNQYYTIKSTSLIRPGIYQDEYEISFKDYLKITNKKSAHVSYLRMKHSVVTLNNFGYPQEILPFVVYGYWGTLGIADMLPMYYGI